MEEIPHITLSDNSLSNYPNTYNSGSNDNNNENNNDNESIENEETNGEEMTEEESIDLYEDFLNPSYLDNWGYSEEEYRFTQTYALNAMNSNIQRFMRTVNKNIFTQPQLTQQEINQFILPLNYSIFKDLMDLFSTMNKTEKEFLTKYKLYIRNEAMILDFFNGLDYNNSIMTRKQGFIDYYKGNTDYDPIFLKEYIKEKNILIENIEPEEFWEWHYNNVRIDLKTHSDYEIYLSEYYTLYLREEVFTPPIQGIEEQSVPNSVFSDYNFSDIQFVAVKYITLPPKEHIHEFMNLIIYQMNRIEWFIEKLLPYFKYRIFPCVWMFNTEEDVKNIHDYQFIHQPVLEDEIISIYEKDKFIQLLTALAMYRYLAEYNGNEIKRKTFLEYTYEIEALLFDSTYHEIELRTKGFIRAMKRLFIENHSL